MKKPEREADFVDIGVGEQRVSPWGCPACHWVEQIAFIVAYAHLAGGMWSPPVFSQAKGAAQPGDPA